MVPLKAKPPLEPLTWPVRCMVLIRATASAPPMARMWSAMIPSAGVAAGAVTGVLETGSVVAGGEPLGVVD